MAYLGRYIKWKISNFPFLFLFFNSFTFLFLLIKKREVSDLMPPQHKFAIRNYSSQERRVKMEFMTFSNQPPNAAPSRCWESNEHWNELKLFPYFFASPHSHVPWQQRIVLFCILCLTSFMHSSNFTLLKQKHNKNMWNVSLSLLSLSRSKFSTFPVVIRRSWLWCKSKFLHRCTKRLLSSTSWVWRVRWKEKHTEKV